MDCRERGSHARGVYLTQDTSRTGTVRVKKEEEAEIRIIVKRSMRYERRERGHYKEVKS